MNNSALMVAFHFPPQAGSSGIQRTLSFSRYLGGYGWQPLVLSASPRAYTATSSSQLSSIPQDVLVKRTFAVDAKRHLGIMGRYPQGIALPDRWISWWLSAVPTALSLIRQHKPSVIWSTFPIATSHLIGLTLQRLTGLPWVADFRDPMLQPDFPNLKWQRKSYGWIERQSILKCDKAVFTTHAAMRAYQTRFDESLHHKFTVIENGYDEEAFNIGASAPMSAHTASNRPITLLHSGVLYHDGRDPSTFLQALACLKQQGRINRTSLQVILRAPGDIPYMQGLVEKYGVKDVVQVQAPIPYQDALREMLSVDGLLVFQGGQFNTQIPAKIYEYFRSRKPIFGLLDPQGETAKVLGAAGFKDIACIDNLDDVKQSLGEFIERVEKGNAYVATPEIVAASSRQHRAQELGQIFNELVTNTASPKRRLAA